MSLLLPASRRSTPRLLVFQRTFSSKSPLLAYAARPAAQQQQQSAAKTSAPSSSAAAPRASPANPLQSSHAQGGSSSSAASPSAAPSSAATPESSLPDTSATDWSSSFSGLGSQPFEARIADVLLAPVDPVDVEIKPDGIIFLPEIKYRRTLNRAFGPGGWGLAPRGPEKVDGKTVSREYALVCMGQYGLFSSSIDRLVAIARGENDFFDPSGVATATEGCKSNALMRCCKDLGIASELWDPKFIREFKNKHAVAVFASNTTNNQKKKLWRRKDDPPFGYPWKEG